jgi:hypothetical protein
MKKLKFTGNRIRRLAKAMHILKNGKKWMG